MSVIVSVITFSLSQCESGDVIASFLQKIRNFPEIFQVSQNLPEYFLYGKYSGQKPLFLLEMVFRQKVEKRELNVTLF